ncbi:MAG: O-antigen ligase family protein [Candidatus Omnitrophica bacterium]|nr:O-antigen ligase family protein [Candidatus Omnitrophota bacterium]
MKLTNVSDKWYRASELCFLGSIFVLPFAKAGFEILFGLTLFLWALSKIATLNSFCADRTLLILFGFLVISSSVSAFNSGYPDLAVRGMIKLIKYVLVLLVSIDLLAHPENLKRLLTIGLLGFGFVLADSLIQNIWGKDLILGYPIQHVNDQIRLTGPYQSYGLLGAHLIAVIPILIAYVIQAKKFSSLRSIWLGGLLSAAFYILYQTQSRGSWLALSCALIIYGFLIRNKWFLVILTTLLLTIPFALPKKILFHMDLFNQEQSLTERKLLWNRAIQVIKARPLFGCGINTYTRNYPKYFSQEQESALIQKTTQGAYAVFPEKEGWRIPGHPNQIPGHYVHNGYLQMAAETGLVSLAFFLAIIGFSFSSAFQALKKAGEDKKPIIAGLICGLIALLLQAVVDTTLNALQSATLVWLFLGLLNAVKNAMARE